MDKEKEKKQEKELQKRRELEKSERRVASRCTNAGIIADAAKNSR